MYITCIYIICNFHTKMNNLTQGSLGQAASSEDFSASEFYYIILLYNKIHLLKNLRMKQPVQVNPGLNCSFSYENCIIMLL